MKISQLSQYVLGLLCALYFLTACNKEADSITPKTLLKLDKVTISDGTFQNYTYDAMGRRSRIDYKDYFTTYNYNGNTITETQTYFDPTKTGTIYTYTLNAQGLASKRTYKVGTTTYTRDMEFDGNGRAIKLIDKSTTSSGVVSTVVEISNEYDSDGDLISSESRYPSTPSNNTTTLYTYDKNHYHTTGVEFSGAEWLGKSSLHSWSKSEITRNNNIKSTVDFPRTYDAKGYMLSSIYSYSTNTATGVVTILSNANYTYK